MIKQCKLKSTDEVESTQFLNTKKSFKEIEKWVWDNFCYIVEFKPTNVNVLNIYVPHEDDYNLLVVCKNNWVVKRVIRGSNILFIMTDNEFKDKYEEVVYLEDIV